MIRHMLESSLSGPSIDNILCFNFQSYCYVSNVIKKETMYNIFHRHVTLHVIEKRNSYTEYISECKPYIVIMWNSVN